MFGGHQGLVVVVVVGSELCTQSRTGGGILISFQTFQIFAWFDAIDDTTPTAAAVISRLVRVKKINGNALNACQARIY